MQLTIDLDAQRIAEESLQQGIDGARSSRKPANAGAVVVLDARTGAVVALASNPTFDPNRFADGTAPDEWLDPHGALNTFDRAFGAYAPGSTFKMITAVAQLEGPDPVRPRRGDVLRRAAASRVRERRAALQRHRPAHREAGRQRLRRSAPCAHGVERRLLLRRRATSSGTRYFQPPPVGEGGDQRGGQHAVARPRRRSRGASRRATGSRRPRSSSGSGRRPASGSAGDQAGRIPTRSFNVELNKTSTDETSRTWRRGDSASLAVGQGDVLVTPLQLANAYAAFANGGTLYTPRLASAVLASGVGLPEGKLGDVVHALDPQMLRTCAARRPEIRNPILAGPHRRREQRRGHRVLRVPQLLRSDVRRQDRHRAGRWWRQGRHLVVRRVHQRGERPQPARSTSCSRSSRRPASAPRCRRPSSPVSPSTSPGTRTHLPSRSAPRRARRTDAHVMAART